MRPVTATDVPQAGFSRISIAAPIKSARQRMLRRPSVSFPFGFESRQPGVPSLWIRSGDRKVAFFLPAVSVAMMGAF